MVAVEQNGKIYETGRNYTVAKKIEGHKGFYSLGEETDGYISKIYYKNNGYFSDKKKKLIGYLVYDYETDIITYQKYIQEQTHVYHKTDSIGINNDIISNLEVKDKILVIENNKKGKKVMYLISVRSALKHGTYVNYKNKEYELQLQVPKEKFKQVVIK
jgi:hypothetical protein